MSCYKIMINDIKQDIYYFLLPKNKDDMLMINVPEIINEKISKYINEEYFDLYLDAINKKYSFKSSKLVKHIMKNNIYGVKSRELYISFRSMSFGFNKKGI